MNTEKVQDSAVMKMSKLRLMFSELKLRSKLIMTYIIVIFMGVFSIGMYSYFQSGRLLDEKSKQTMDYALQIVLSDVENNMYVYNDMIMGFATNKNMYDIIDLGYDKDRDGATWASMDDIFLRSINTISYNHAAISQFTLYTERKLPEIAKSLLSADRVSDKEWYKEARDGFMIRWNYKEGSVFITCPMINIWSRGISDCIGVLCVSVDQNKFFENIGKNNNTEYILSVSDENNECIYTSAGNKNVLKSDNGGSRVRADGQEYICSSADIGDIGWKIKLYMPAASLRMGVKNVIAAIVVVCVICMFILIVLSIWISGFMTKRISVLNEKMKQVQAGNFDIEIYSDINDEIGCITNSFASMVKELKKTIDTLYTVKLAKQKQEMKVLQAQINPHFLYNVLSTIEWKALEADDDETAYMVGLLSSFYKTSLNKGRVFTVLGMELENVKAYMSMQMIMHNNSFMVYYDVDTSLLECPCVNFIIQPIAENAIEHGTDRLENGGGVVKIKVEAVENGCICITISDNGPEPERGEIKAIVRKKTRGYGVWNVQERIRLAYGEKYGIVYSRERGETKAKITFPKENKK